MLFFIQYKGGDDELLQGKQTHLGGYLLVCFEAPTFHLHGPPGEDVG